MKFSPCVSVHGRVKTAVFAGFVFWAGMTLAMVAYFLPTNRSLEQADFFVISAVSLAGAVLFGLAMWLRHPLIPLSSSGFDDGGEGLGVPARLIPPSPVLGARAFPEPDDKEVYRTPMPAGLLARGG